MKQLMILMVFMALAASSFAATVVIDNFDDYTDYSYTLTSTADANDSAAFAAAGSPSEGTEALQVTLTWTVDQPAWYKGWYVTKEFTTPVDISEGDVFKYDYKAPMNSYLNMYLYVEDQNGARMRLPDSGFFASDTTSAWATATYYFSDLEKSKWHGQGKSIDLKKIVKVIYNFGNGALTAVADSPVVVKLDNFRMETEQIRSETVLDDFESYSDTAALETAWPDAYRDPSLELSATGGYDGSQGMLLSIDNTQPLKDTRHGVELTLDNPMNFAASAYVKMNVKGDTRLDGVGSFLQIELVDGSGNRCLGFMWDVTGVDEWTEMYLPFQTDGVAGFLDDAWTYEWEWANGNSCWREDRWDYSAWDDDADLDDIRSIRITASSGGEYTGDATIAVDNIMVGYSYAGDADKTYIARYLDGTETKPAIDGSVASGEWDAADTAGSGFVHHDSPATAATEDGAFQILFDDSYMYILFQMSDAYIAGYATPPTPFGYSDLGGDKINFFMTPYGISTDPFYRLMFSWNPSDTTCYVWGQASAIKTNDSSAGTDWDFSGDSQVGASYSGGNLIIEYKIAWSEFDYAGANAAARPDFGSVWGIQPGISNEVSSGSWEWVNWEPDETSGYVSGEPFGALQFDDSTTSISDWNLY